MQDLKVRKLLEKANKIALFGHVHPDGDCIWSMLGLWALLEKQGKKVSYFTPTLPSKIFDFLKATKKIKTTFDYGTYDVLVFVDFSDYKRIDQLTKWHEQYFDDHALCIIDHHHGDEPKHALCIKDAESMSTAELVFEYAYKRWPKLFDKQIATSLYMWLTMDSWNFVYDIDHERVLGNALRLVKLWADKWLVVSELIRKKSLNSVRFMELFLHRMKQVGDLIYSYYTDEDFETFDIDDEEAGYGLKIMQNVDGPRLSLVFKKVADTMRVSLRSKKTAWKLVDCNAVARKFGGGGHIPAAGFTVAAKGNFGSQVKKIVGEIEKMIM